MAAAVSGSQGCPFHRGVAEREVDYELVTQAALRTLGVSRVPQSTGLWNRLANTWHYYRMGILGFMRYQMERGDGSFYPIKKVHLLHRTLIIVTDPTLMHQVLRKLQNDDGEEGYYYGGEQRDALSTVIGSHMVNTAEKEEHDREKGFMLRELMGAGQVRRATSETAEFVAEQADRCGGGRWSTIELARFLAVPTINNYVFGPREVRPDLLEHIRYIEKTVERIALYQLRLPLWIDGRYKRARAAMDNAVDRVARIEMQNVAEGGPVRGLFAKMELARGDDGERRFSEEEIRQVVKMVLFVGQGTTSRLLSSVLYRLAKHPEWQEAIREDVDREVRDGPLCNDHLALMPHLNNFILETQRLHGPVWSHGRRVKRQLSLNGEVVGKGTVVIPVPYLAERDSRRWKDPETFLPERFEDPVVNRRGTHTFGDGPNRCMGKFPARNIIQCTVVELLRRYEIVLRCDTPIGEHAGLFLEADQEIPIELRPRVR